MGRIYNSRNSFGLLVFCLRIPSMTILSTIVEIHLAYQSKDVYLWGEVYLQQQKFIWLISPSPIYHTQVKHLQQQKFIWLISRNSRKVDYLDLQQQKFIWLISPALRKVKGISYLQQQKFIWLISPTLQARHINISTIVEIHLAYQSKRSYSGSAKSHLQQQKFIWLISHPQ